MGGGSGYTTFTGSFGNTGGVSGCDLNIITHIINPEPSLTNRLVVGDMLIVVLDSNLVTIQNNQRQIIGTISPPNINQLIDCINQGNVYNARIIEISGGYIRVQVNPQS